MSLQDKHAIVTGGNRGIGLAVARALAAAGARVSVISRTAAPDGEFFAAPADVLEQEQLFTAISACRRQNGAIAILINNSGIAESAPFKRTGRPMWDRIIGTNLTGTFMCTKLVIDEMLESRYGRIVNVASVAGLFGAPYISAYCASKHGVMGLTRALAAELAQTGVTVNAVCPGYTETDMMAGAIANIVKRTGISEAQAREELAKTNPSGRIVTPQEVADAVVQLCSSGETGREIVL